MTKIKLIRGNYPNSGNDPENPNGMKMYSYRGRKIAAYCAADVPNRFRYLYPGELRNRKPKN